MRTLRLLNVGTLVPVDNLSLTESVALLQGEKMATMVSVTETSPDIGWIDCVVLAVVTDMLLLDIPLHRLPHVVGILT